MKKTKPFILFYLLVAYVFLQFVWWAYHIIDLNGEIYELKVQIEKLESPEPEGRLAFLNALEEKRNYRRLMVMGEGAVFLILLGIGFYVTQRTFIKEVALSKQQKNFLLSITHELKTPLASVKLYLQTLQKRELDEEKKASVIGKAVMDADRLTNLVDNILLATQIEQGTYPFHSERLNFSELIAETVAYFNGQGELKGEEKNSVVLSPSFQKGLHVIGDKSALSSLLLNLIDNGLKYAEKDSVVIDLKKSDNNLSFSVSNQGMALSSEEKDRIFDKFYRVGDEDTRKKPGTGLGLFIVKYIVEKHKGSIVVKDNMPSGCIFEVCLEIAQ